MLVCVFSRGILWGYNGHCLKIFSLVRRCPSLCFGFSREFFLEIFFSGPIGFSRLPSSSASDLG